MRSLLFLILLLALLLLIVGCASQTERSQPVGPPQRFVLIVSDTLRADHLGCYGQRKDISPHLDALAKRSILYQDAMTAGSWTYPSNCALFTGRYPHEVGDPNVPCLVDQTTTIAEYFQAAGFQTACFSSHPIIDPKWNFDQGFDTFERGKPWGQDGETVDKAVTWWQENPDGPALLVVYLFDPHEPYDPKEVPSGLKSAWPKTRGMIRDGKVPMAKNQRRPVFVENPASNEELTHAELDILHQLYFADITEVDAHIGRLLEAIGDDPRTVIAFLSDHGEEWLEHGGLRHKELPYQEILHIPFILHVPAEKPRTVAAPVSNLDLLPTFLSLAGIDPGDDLQGQSLLPDAGISASRPLFSEALHSDELNDQVRIDAFAARSGTRSLVHLLTAWPDDPPLPEGGRWEFYDLAADPAQQSPLLVEGRAGDLRDALLEFERAAQTPVTQEKQGDSTTKHGLDEELRKELETLGYLGK